MKITILLALLFGSKTCSSWAAPKRTTPTIGFPKTPFSTTASSRRSISPLNTMCSETDPSDPTQSTITEPISIGFLGCGTIASAIATGLATQTDFPVKSISVSRRSEQKSRLLAERFPDLVTVFGEENGGNQEILNQSDFLFLCMLPEHARGVLEGLVFDKERHVLVSLVSTSNLEDLCTFSGLSENSVCKMICLPSVSTHQGVCQVVPKLQNHNPSLKPMFESLGGCVQCENEDIMRKLMIPGCMMGPLYGIMRKNAEWLVKNGVPAGDASYFVAKQYMGMVKDAVDRDCRGNPDVFEDLVKEQTPGGLNEQALQNLEGRGLYEDYDMAMDATLSRLEGKTDGYVDEPKS